MEKETTEGLAVSVKIKKLIQKIEDRDTTRKMSDEELRSLRRAIDDEVIRRKVVEHILILAEQLK